MTQARQTYIKALQLTNRALRDPVAVKQDSTLFAVLVLGMFETVSGSCEDSLVAWTKHVEGASALVKLRGMEQFATELGQHMFFQTLVDGIASSWQRSLPTPPHIVAMFNMITQSIPEGNSRYTGIKLVEAMIDVTIFRASLLTSSATPDSIIARALELDERFRVLMDLGDGVPEAWRYEIVRTEEGEMKDLVWDREYHIYPDWLTLRNWCGVRASRIHLHEIIRGHILLSPHLDTVQFQASAVILKRCMDDILASVPHNFSDLAAERSLRNGDQNGLVLWLLYLVSVMDQSTEKVRKWVAQRLRGIAGEVGMKQAWVLADYIENGRHFENEEGVQMFGSKHYALEEGRGNFELRTKPLSW